MSPMPAVLIEWEDSFNGDHNWIHLAEVPDNLPPMIVRTLGFLIRQDEQRITLAQSMTSHGDEPPTVCDLFTIPRGCVRSLTHLGDRHAASQEAEGTDDRRAARPAR